MPYVIPPHLSELLAAIQRELNPAARLVVSDDPAVGDDEIDVTPAVHVQCHTDRTFSVVHQVGGRFLFHPERERVEDVLADLRTALTGGAPEPEPPRPAAAEAEGAGFDLPAGCEPYPVGRVVRPAGCAGSERSVLAACRTPLGLVCFVYLGALGQVHAGYDAPAHWDDESSPDGSPISDAEVEEGCRVSADLYVRYLRSRHGFLSQTDLGPGGEAGRVYVYQYAYLGREVVIAFVDMPGAARTVDVHVDGRNRHYPPTRPQNVLAAREWAHEVIDAMDAPVVATTFDGPTFGDGLPGDGLPGDVLTEATVGAA